MTPLKRSEITKIVFNHVHTFIHHIGEKLCPISCIISSVVRFICTLYVLQIRQQLGVVVWHVQFKTHLVVTPTRPA